MTTSDYTEYRIFGPPGTGKTTFLGRQAYQAVERHGPDRVLIASFTRTAAAEIAGRDTGVAREMIGTLHALGYRALDRPPLAESHGKEWNETCPLSYRLPEKRVRSTADLDDPYSDEAERDDDAPGSDLLQEYSRYRAEMTLPTFIPFHVRAFGEQWEQWKSENGYVDFTDMIALPLAQHLPVPGWPKVGLFDEVQDFSALELALVRSWAEQLDYVILAGDDDQCLYRFKGASPRSFLNPPVDAAHKRVLSQSHRVPRVIQSLAQAWIEQVELREPKAYAPRDAEGTISDSDATWKHPDELVDEIAADVAAGRTAMALASCGYMLAPLIRELKAQGIPFHNPYRRRKYVWNPLTPASGVSTVERLASYLQPAGARGGWTIRQLQKWSSMLRAEGVLARNAKSTISRLPASDREVTGEELSAWFVSAEPLMAAWQGNVQWLREHTTAQYAEQLAYPTNVYRRGGVQALTATPLLTVGTIHSVKGGESGSVYLFPDLSPSGYAEWEGEADAHDTVRRLFYVGFTRARDRLVLCRSSSRQGMAVKWEW